MSHGGHRWREAELEAGKKWEKGTEVVWGELKREKDEDEAGGKSQKWEMELQAFTQQMHHFLSNIYIFEQVG